MKPVRHVWQAILATFTIGAAVAGPMPAALAASPANPPNHGANEPLLAAPFPGTATATPDAGGSPLAKEMAVLTNKGISPARAMRALDVQGKIAPTHLASMVETTLGHAYAGLWYAPAAAKFHVGVTSTASEHAIARAAAHAGLSAYVVETHVRSTWAALARTQSAWSKKLTKLLASAEAMTGLSASHNALAITLSSSVPLSERVMLEDEAAASSVNVSIATAPPEQLHIDRKATCTEPFVEKAVFCEPTMVSGVRIVTPKTGCTGGPLLISGPLTFLLTAGHCFNKEEPGGINFNNLTVTSAYPEKEPQQKEIGKEGKYYNNNERDMGEVRISSPNFSQGLPTPVPALMAQWAKGPKTPHTVDGEIAATEGIMACHEGQASGEHCGVIGKVNVEGAGTKHVVEIGACSNAGDSGGPYFVRSKGESILMTGTEVGGPPPDCTKPGPYQSFFEPLIDLPEAKGFGILSSFAGQELLTTANETRKIVLPDVHLLEGEKYPLHVTFEDNNETPFLLETVGGGTLKGKGVLLLLLTNELSALGTFETNLLNVEEPAAKAKCHSPGDAAGEVLTSGEYHVVLTKFTPGIAFLVKEVTIECGALKIKVKGCVLSSLESEEKTDVTAIKGSLAGEKGKNTLTKYFNDESKEVECKIESNFGVGFKQSAEIVNEGKPIELKALESKMFTILGI